MSDEASNSEPVEDHADWGDVLDSIEERGSQNKSALVAILYDESGEGRTKKELRACSRGYLLALAVDQDFGANYAGR